MSGRGTRQLDADLVSAWAVALGIGLISLMLTWLIGNRLSSLVLDPPLGPTFSLLLALLVGGVTASFSARRLAATIGRAGAA